MATDVPETPFIKELAASDRPTREKALGALQAYLLCGRRFTYLDLLKIWRGLFFCIFHTANPLPQQRLSRSLASLLLALPEHVFVPFIAAFFHTMIDYWSSIPSLRLDKYLFLIRLYVSHSFTYLAQRLWEEKLVHTWIAAIMGPASASNNTSTPSNMTTRHQKGNEDEDDDTAVRRYVLDPLDGKVGDGLRYHVLDVWVDGLVNADNWRVGISRGVMRPVEKVAREGIMKTLRQRAAAVAADGRLRGDTAEDDDDENDDDDDRESKDDDEEEDEEFEGFD